MNVVTKRVFVLMPFSEEFEDVYLVITDAVREASKHLGIEVFCCRADDISKPGRITEQIIEEISNADLLIAELSGTNPNVMYELGYGHALEKIAIIINQNIHEAPFDVKDFRQIIYDRNRLIKDCRPSLVAAIHDALSAQDANLDDKGAGEKTDDNKLSKDPTRVTAPIRPDMNLVAVLQVHHLKLQYANANSNETEARTAADEVRELLSRVTVASGSERSEWENTAVIAGNCAVEMEKAELQDHAETVFRRALVLFPDYAGLHLQYCSFLLSADRYDEAHQEFERAKALPLDTEDSRNIENLEIMLSLRTGAKSKEAGMHLEQNFENDPSDRVAAASYLLYLDRSDAPLREFEEACAKWKAASPSEGQWAADRALADHLAKQNIQEHTERAAKVYEDLLGMPGQTSQDVGASLHNLAQLYERLNKRELARETWKKAYESCPDDSAVRALFSQRLASWGEIDAAMAVAEGKPFPTNAR